MTTKTKIIIYVASVLTALAVGRWSAPEKIKTEIKTIEVQTQTKDTNDHKKIVVVEHDDKDGSKNITTTTTDDKSVNVITDTSITQDKTKEVTKSTSKLHLAALAGTSFTNVSSPIYGGYVSKDILGPISIGVWGMSNATGGAAIGLSF